MFRIKSLSGDIVEIQTLPHQRICHLKRTYISQHAPDWTSRYSYVILLDETGELPDDKPLIGCNRDLHVFHQPDYIEEECLRVVAIPNPNPPYLPGLQVTYHRGVVKVDSVGLKPSQIYFAQAEKPLLSGSYFSVAVLYGAAGLFIGSARIFFTESILVKYTDEEVIVLDDRDRVHHYPIERGEHTIILEVKNPGYHTNPIILLEQAKRPRVASLESLLK